jgi:hypothetical protein
MTSGLTANTSNTTNQTMKFLPIKRLPLKSTLHITACLSSRVGAFYSRHSATLGKISAVVTASVMGAVLAFYGWNVACVQPLLVSSYNAAMKDLRDTLAAATPFSSNNVDCWKKAVDAYEQSGDLDLLQRLFWHADEIAAQTRLKGALVVIEYADRPPHVDADKQRFAAARESLLQAIELDPGFPYSDAVEGSEGNRLQREAMAAQFDLELFFIKHPELKKQRKQSGDQKDDSQVGDSDDDNTLSKQEQQHQAKPSNQDVQDQNTKGKDHAKLDEAKKNSLQKIEGRGSTDGI